MEGIGAVGAVVGTGWAAIAEFAPLSAKAVAGAMLAAVGAASAIKAWREKTREDREEDK